MHELILQIDWWYGIWYYKKSVTDNTERIFYMTKQDFLKTIPGFKKICPIFSQATRMPMVFCHEETMDDYIYIYLEEQDAAEKAKALTEEKMPAFVVNCKEKEVLPFLAELRFTGVNAICFVTPKENGAEEFMVQLTEFLKFPDPNSLPADKRPVDNPSLHLSILYFMQEVRRPVAKEVKENLAELEEETSAGIARAKFAIPVNDVADTAEGKKGIMLLKNEKGDVFMPLFTDPAELRKFLKGQNCQVFMCGFAAVADMMKKGSATGIVINPASSNVVLSKQGVESVEKRFLE